MDGEFDVDGFLAEFFGQIEASAIPFPAILKMLLALPIDGGAKKKALIVILDRRGMPLERWMVEAIGVAGGER